MGFSESLKQHRIKAGYSSAKEFAARLGLSYSTYVAYENTDREPRFNILIKIADILNVSIDELLERHVDETSQLKTWLESNGFEVNVMKRSDNKAFYQVRESSRVLIPLSSVFLASEDVLKRIYGVATELMDVDVHNLIVKLLSANQNEAVAISMMKLFHAPEYKAIRDELLSIDPFFFNSYSACAPKELKLTDEDLRSIEEIFSRCFPVISK